MKKRKIEVIKHIMTFGGVEIFGRVDGNDDSKVAQLEIISSIIQNAFVPLSVKTELENERLMRDAK